MQVVVIVFVFVVVVVVVVVVVPKPNPKISARVPDGIPSKIPKVFVQEYCV